MLLRSWLALTFICGGSLLARDALAQAPGDAPPPEPAASEPAPPPPPPAPPPGMQPPPPQALVGSPLARTHHGAFVRILLGPGGFDTKATLGTDTYEVSGGGGGFSLAVGGAISPSLVIYGEVFDDIAMSPSLTMNGQSSGMTGQNVNAGVVGFGPGIAYYLPSNVYVGATLALARLTIQQDNQELAHSDTGYGVSAHIGKEWWVSDSWGVGIAGQVFAGTIPDGQANTSWTTFGGALAFSATYN